MTPRPLSSSVTNFCVLSQFQVDRILDPGASQADVFEACGQPFISNFFQGYNGTIMACACVLAYGRHRDTTSFPCTHASVVVPWCRIPCPPTRAPSLGRGGITHEPMGP